MRSLPNRALAPVALALLAVPAWSGLSAQGATDPITVTGEVPADLTGLTEGPEIEGTISARGRDGIQVTAADGTVTTVMISQATDIRSSGGFLGLQRTSLGADALLNGLPVTVQTVEWEGGLVASRVRFKNSNLQTASMIHTGTAQRFGENEAAIAENAPPRRCAGASATSTSTTSSARPTSTSTPTSGT